MQKNTNQTILFLKNNSESKNFNIYCDLKTHLRHEIILNIKVNSLIEDSVEQAKASPLPSPEDVTSDVYVSY